MANTLKLYLKGAVGFIVWLGLSCLICCNDDAILSDFRDDLPLPMHFSKSELVEDVADI